MNFLFWYFAFLFFFPPLFMSMKVYMTVVYSSRGLSCSDLGVFLSNFLVKY